ncbi:hypothetical protein GRF29_19g684722 [Pseudopithomyces chartarum]|uniref:Isochorismatase-like domain-containing protein n=1 Tax=Pseudopithomyces chartarum TaxID=1892770 RepID=A0AAN6RJD2_9PLEO|nr:hypothetical protein GRF29_19g684722 [Pseudopithomyces chartarum]
MASPSPTNPTTPSHYTSSQTALLLLDFHNMLVDRNPSNALALATAVSTKKWAKSQGIHIIHCLIDSTSKPFPTAKNIEHLASAMSLFKSAAGNEAPSLVEDANGEVTFTRRIGHVSALKSKGLMEYLEENGIRSLALMGLIASHVREPGI